MMENLAGLDALAHAVFAANAEKGFWDVPDCIKLESLAGGDGAYGKLKRAEKIALIHSELSECLEGIRKPGPDQHCPEFTQEEIEMADALIRILDYAGGFHLRLAEAVSAKLAFNASRPHKHGKAF